MKVGIDIGTSYSSIAILDRDGRAQPVKVANGASVFGDSYSLPSAAYVEEDGTIDIGQLAVASRMKDPSRYISEFKRDLGQQVPYNLDQLQLMPEDLYKEIFIHLKKCAEEVSGEKISKAYITYPAHFSKKKIELIELAAQKSGLLDVELIDEPTAAAYCYCSMGKIKENDKLLVYDFGGGTFDLALIEYVDNGFRPVTEALGIDKCGGVDIDRLIYEDIYNSISAEAIEMINNNEMVRKRFNTQIMELSVKIKHQLSSKENFSDAIAVGFDYLDYELSRDKMNKLISPIVEETLQKVNDIVENAAINMSDISTCLMVGGTSRIPYIRERLEETNGKSIYKDIDPELAVCMGAALWEVQQEQEKVSVTIESRVVDDIRENEIASSVKEGGNKLNDTDSKNHKYGNTPGNIVNYSQYAKQGDWVFYNKRVKGAPIGLYKVRIDGSDNTYLNTNGYNINVVGDWVYFIDDKKVYKIRTDGSGKTKINDDYSSFINVVDDWIYYQNNNDKEKLYKIRTNGTGRIKLNDEKSWYINVVDDCIYYVKYSFFFPSLLFKINTDGTGKIQLNSDKSSKINVLGGWIYYCNRSDNGNLYKIDINGIRRIKINDDRIGALNVSNGWIYYSNESDDNKLYRIRIDGSERTKLSNDRIVMSIHILGIWLYYSTSDAYGNPLKYRIRTDGTERQRVD